jgi:hypothetical protein
MPHENAMFAKWIVSRGCRIDAVRRSDAGFAERAIQQQSATLISDQTSEHRRKRAENFLATRGLSPTASWMRPRAAWKYRNGGRPMFSPASGFLQVHFAVSRCRKLGAVPASHVIALADLLPSDRDHNRICEDETRAWNLSVICFAGCFRPATKTVVALVDHSRAVRKDFARGRLRYRCYH